MKHSITKPFLLAVFVLTGLVNAVAQRTVTGSLKDVQTKQAVEFANIGIVGKGVGTVTDENGAYTLVIPDSVAGEPVRISRIGYKSQQLSVEQLVAKPVVSLEQSATALNEVAVSAKKLKIKMAGNDTKTRSVTAGFKKNSLGAEIAVKINVKAPKTQIRRFFINIAANVIEKPIFRFNLYSVDSKGGPKENLLTNNIIFEPKEKTGLVELDLTPYNIVVDDDVFIAIEWVKDLGDVNGLGFSTKLVGSSSWYRQASQDDWHKIPSVGIGLHAEIAY